MPAMSPPRPAPPLSLLPLPWPPCQTSPPHTPTPPSTGHVAIDALASPEIARPGSASMPWTSHESAPRAPSGHLPPRRPAQPLDPPASALSTHSTPRRRWTRSRPRPAPAVAGEANPGPPRTRRTWKKHDTARPSPTKLSPPRGPWRRHEHTCSLA